jgi:hypothetical protein
MKDVMLKGSFVQSVEGFVETTHKMTEKQCSACSEMLSYEAFRETWYENLTDEIKRDLNSMFALDAASELESICVESYNAYCQGFKK